MIGSPAPTSPGWWDTHLRKQTVEAFSAESDPQKRIALWADVQKAMYEEIPYMKIGDFNAVAAKSKKIEGIEAAPWPYFWNTSIKK